MELTTTETVTKTITIETPSYFKSNCHYVKVIKDNIIVVADTIEHKRVSTDTIEYFFPKIYNLPSNEAEFEKKYEEIIKVINNLKNK